MRERALSFQSLAGGLEVYIHARDAKYLKFRPEHKIKEGHIFEFGSERLDVVHTPGHSPGGICLLDRRGRNAFTGDTVFPYRYRLHNI